MDYSLLKSVFGHEAFRPGQEELIQTLDEGRDLLGVMATGSGKSLCYQFPAIEKKRRCLVISPLISLMNDQVQKLELAGVPAAGLHSQVTAAMRQSATTRWQSGTLRFLYAAPERMADPSFNELLDRSRPDYVVIDEAHCISHWGHDFRPDYQALGKLKDRFDVPIAAFTATATPQVQREIVLELRLRRPLVRVHGFYRSNLRLAATLEANERRRAERIEAALRAALSQGGAGIVYCSSRAKVEELTAELRRQGLPAFAYHAGLPSEERERSHAHFQEDSPVVLVATNAFGMGVDRPDVRCVLHAQMPGTVEAYYQEAGRAGRDGRAATCLLLHSPGDIAIHEFFNRQSVDSVAPEEREAWELHKQEQLDLMRRYVYSADCRQREIMTYFGDREELLAGCGHCDNCQAPAAEAVNDDLQQAVRILLSGAARLEGRFGAAQLTDLVTGSDTVPIRRWGHDKLPTYGRLKTLPKRQVRSLIQELVRQGYLQQGGLRYPVLSLSAEGRDVMHDRQRARLSSAASAPEESRPRRKTRKTEAVMVGESSASPVDETLREMLRAWRLQKSRELRIPPYTLFWDRTLEELCRKRPQQPEDLIGIWGIGEQKRRRFGDELTALIRSAP